MYNAKLSIKIHFFVTLKHFILNSRRIKHTTYELYLTNNEIITDM